MVDDLRTIAASFDQRAARYATVEWHRAYARRFVELASLEPGQRVLDAGAGTGFATIEIARRVGAAGHVVAVDVSAGMLAQLRFAVDAANLSSVELIQDDATISLPCRAQRSTPCCVRRRSSICQPIRHCANGIASSSHAAPSASRRCAPIRRRQDGCFVSALRAFGLTLKTPAPPSDRKSGAATLCTRQDSMRWR